MNARLRTMISHPLAVLLTSLAACGLVSQENDSEETRFRSQSAKLAVKFAAQANRRTNGVTTTPLLLQRAAEENNMTVLILEDPQLISRYEQFSRLPPREPSGPEGTQVFFPFDSSTLDDNSRDLLLAHARYLQSHPDRKLQVHGHADRSGKPIYNLQLSRLRADSVCSFLTANGALPRQLASYAWGSADPLRQSADPAQNRRVELIYLP